MYDRGIEAFMAIASSRTLSEAAKRLNITQPAVSHRIKELETQLGMILLDRQRGSRFAELTQAGEMFYPIAQRWMELWHETKDIQSAFLKMSVRIGCVDSVSRLIMLGFYRKLAQNDPPIHLRIHTMRSLGLYEKIVSRELDVAFVLQRQYFKHIEVEPLYEEPMCVVRSVHKGSIPATVDLEDLEPEKEIYINWSPSYQTWHDHQWNGIQHSRIEMDTISLVLKFMENTDTWAIVPQSVLTEIKSDKSFVIQRPIQPVPNRVTYMVTHRYPRIGGRQGIEIIRDLAAQFEFYVKSSQNQAIGN